MRSPSTTIEPRRKPRRIRETQAPLPTLAVEDTGTLSDEAIATLASLLVDATEAPERPP